MAEQGDFQLDARTSIRRAGPMDFETVLAVVQDASRRVQEIGLPQWKSYLTDWGSAQVRSAVDGADGMEVYLAERDGRAVGTLRIQWRDRDCWGERGDDGQAGYVHMLAVHREARREGLGAKMLAWAERLIARRGRPFCRLDCWCRSFFLTTYYPQFGYVVQQVEGAPSGVMNFQKTVRQ